MRKGYHYGQVDPDAEPGPADLHEEERPRALSMDEAHARDMRLDSDLSEADRLLGKLLDTMHWRPAARVAAVALREDLKREREHLVARWN